MVSLTRRWFVTGGALVLAAAAADLEPAPAQTAPPSVGPADPRLVEDLVAANRILADQNVLDGYGHVSARHDRDPSRYLMSRDRKSTRLNSSHGYISYAVFCLKKKKKLIPG